MTTNNTPEALLAHRPKGIHSSKHSPLRENTMANQGDTEESLFADYTCEDNLHTSLHPSHFLVRPRISPSVPARLVPLIPVDLLPDYISIEGLDRNLSTAQASGMKSIGTFDRPAGSAPYKLRFIPADAEDKSVPVIKGDADTPPASSGASAADGSCTSGPDLSQPSSDTDTDPRRPTPFKLPTKAPKKKGSAPIDRILASASAAAAQHLPARPGKKAKKPPPASSSADAPPPPPGSPCRHYCHHGTCRFGLHCRYKHVVPTTSEGLSGVGLRELPAWLVRKMREAEAEDDTPASAAPARRYQEHSEKEAARYMVESLAEERERDRHRDRAARAKRTGAPREGLERKVAMTEQMARIKVLVEEEKMKRVTAARENRMAAAHEAAAAAAVGEGDVEEMLVDI